MSHPDDGFARAAAGAVMVPLLPCGDIDELARFWSALGLEKTYRQIRPNPYVALRAGRIDLHYYGMPVWEPTDSHSSCVIVVPDPRPINERFRAGLRELYGRVPISGAPRITRARERANNGGLSGFSVIDPAGNWIRVTRASEEVTPAGEDATTSWTTRAQSALGRALENAIVIGDSHGDEKQARKVITGALRRDVDALPSERGGALAYLVELHLRLDDPDAAERSLAELESLSPDADGQVAAVIAEAHDTLRSAGLG